jgi:hypothetical protein
VFLQAYKVSHNTQQRPFEFLEDLPGRNTAAKLTVKRMFKRTFKNLLQLAINTLPKIKKSDRD